jgi:hypothetical protein
MKKTTIFLILSLIVCMVAYSQMANVFRAAGWTRIVGPDNKIYVCIVPPIGMPKDLLCVDEANYVDLSNVPEV